MEYFGGIEFRIVAVLAKSRKRDRVHVNWVTWYVRGEREREREGGGGHNEGELTQLVEGNFILQKRQSLIVPNEAISF